MNEETTKAVVMDCDRYVGIISKDGKTLSTVICIGTELGTFLSVPVSLWIKEKKSPIGFNGNNEAVEVKNELQKHFLSPLGVAVLRDGVFHVHAAIDRENKIVVFRGYSSAPVNIVRYFDNGLPPKIYKTRTEAEKENPGIPVLYR